MDKLDKVFIANIYTQAVIGIYDFEKVAPQELIVSVELGTDIRLAAKADDIQYALDYDLISKFMDKYIRESRFELLETLAETLIQNLFANFAMQSVKLKIQKPQAITFTKEVGIEVYRER